MTRSIGATVASLWLLALASPAFAAEDAAEPKDVSWPTEGVFGSFDRAALQRGYQVYTQVCHSCHSLNYLAFRNLSELGFNEDEVRALAAQFEVTDGPNDAGEMFTRPARPSDRMPPPFPNEAAARVANGGALPPDGSLLAKSREGGPSYIYSVLTGYVDPPEGFEVPDVLYYNPYFPGRVIAMPPPLFPDSVTYEDGTSATVEQMARDVAEFMYFVAEPKLEERKQMGLRAMLFLFAFTGIMYAYKRKVWSDVH